MTAIFLYCQLITLPAHTEGVSPAIRTGLDGEGITAPGTLLFWQDLGFTMDNGWTLSTFPPTLLPAP